MNKNKIIIEYYFAINDAYIHINADKQVEINCELEKGEAYILDGEAIYINNGIYDIGNNCYIYYAKCYSSAICDKHKEEYLENKRREQEIELNNEKIEETLQKPISTLDKIEDKIEKIIIKYPSIINIVTFIAVTTWLIELIKALFYNYTPSKLILTIMYVIVIDSIIGSHFKIKSINNKGDK